MKRPDDERVTSALTPLAAAALGDRSAPSRRAFLAKAGRTAGAAATVAALRAAFPYGAFSQGRGPEVKKASFGYIALTDAAPLIIAKEKGIFAKYGMPDVDIAKQASWGALRDNLELGNAGGGLDGAHILSPFPYLISAGRVTKGNAKIPMYVLARLNVNGQSISVAKKYANLKVGKDCKPLKDEFARMKAAGTDVHCAMTFRGGTHDLWIRYWLAAGGVDPDKDLALIVVPPPQMVANMKVGSMEAFCVGEPWNAQLVNQQIGFTALTTGELWHDHPEKAFSVRADWADKNPEATKAALQAILEAQQWCDTDANKPEMCQILAKRAWFNVPYEDIIGRIQGSVDYGDGRKLDNNPYLMKFWRDHASYPFQSHDLWFLTEHKRWGIIPADTDVMAEIKKVNREDLWREAAKVVGVAADQMPAGTSRGPETFFDGKIFDPKDPAAYLASLAVTRT